MRGAFTDQGGLFSYISPETRVPANHPLRKIRDLVRDVLGEMNRSLGKLYASSTAGGGSRRRNATVAFAPDRRAWHKHQQEEKSHHYAHTDQHTARRLVAAAGRVEHAVEGPRFVHRCETATVVSWTWPAREYWTLTLSPGRKTERAFR